MAEHKLDIFKVLGELDKKNIKFFDTLSDEEQKAFQPLVVMRWLTGTSNKNQVNLINEVVNPYVFKFTNHKGLLYKLMTVCTTGRKQKYVWKKASTKGSTQSITVKAIQQYYGYNRHDAENALKILSQDTLLEIVDELGWQDEELNKLRKELGLPAIRKPKSSSKSPKPDFDINEW
jgi:hypothetical protein